MLGPRRRIASLLAVAITGAVTLAAGCGASAEDGGAGAAPAEDRGGAADGGQGTGGGGFADTGAGPPNQDAFVPEDEEFLVRQVAVADNFVFVPNSDTESTTVARIDGRDLSVRPIRVGLQPVDVRAATVEGQGTVAYVLSEGQSVVAIVRADRLEDGDDGSSAASGAVNLVPVPPETNAIALSPDGRHLLAYIDPDKPLPEDANVASLQVLSLIRLGESPEADVAHQLSVTRLIDEIEFTEDGSEAFVIGREGVNRLDLGAIEADTFVPPLGLGLSGSAFPPKDREVEVSPDGDFLAVRSSAYAGVALYRPAPEESSDADGKLRTVGLPAPPTDIDLHVPDDGPATVVVSLRDSGQVALVDVATVLQTNGSSNGGSNNGSNSGSNGQNGGNGDTGTGDAGSSGPAPGVELIDAKEAEPGLAQLTPDQESVLLYTTLATRPYLGFLDLASRRVATWRLRNQIRSVAVGPNSETAVIVHEKQDGPPESDAGPLEFFQHNHAITLVDLETGYRRPITLQADPRDIVMTTDDEGTPLVFAMLQSHQPDKRGLMRINLDSYRTDFYRLPRQPTQLGVVAGKVFVSQEAGDGRITFFDLQTGEGQTVSGYELNAGID